ncbi:MAG: phosphoribosyl-ATP diphosphatase [Coriobacteriia bacterium]|nr:phosphoribosyl-ATP diphosphatase [Coriobacteriia bacterium]
MAVGDEGCLERTVLGTEYFGAVIDALWATIESRRGADPDTSYTARLLVTHEDKLLKKIGEEATEVVMAAKDADRGQLAYEAADLVYHLLVVFARYGLSPDDLADELATRFK